MGEGVVGVGAGVGGPHEVVGAGVGGHELVDDDSGSAEALVGVGFGDGAQSLGEVGSCDGAVPALRDELVALPRVKRKIKFPMMPNYICFTLYFILSSCS